MPGWGWKPRRKASAAAMVRMPAAPVHRRTSSGLRQVLEVKAAAASTRVAAAQASEAHGMQRKARVVAAAVADDREGQTEPECRHDARQQRPAGVEQVEPGAGGVPPGNGRVADVEVEEVEYHLAADVRDEEREHDAPG